MPACSPLGRLEQVCAVLESVGVARSERKEGGVERDPPRLIFLMAFETVVGLVFEVAWATIRLPINL